MTVDQTSYGIATRRVIDTRVVLSHARRRLRRRRRRTTAVPADLVRSFARPVVFRASRLSRVRLHAVRRVWWQHDDTRRPIERSAAAEPKHVYILRVYYTYVIYLRAARAREIRAVVVCTTLRHHYRRRAPTRSVRNGNIITLLYYASDADPSTRRRRRRRTSPTTSRPGSGAPDVRARDNNGKTLRGAVCGGFPPSSCGARVGILHAAGGGFTRCTR